MNSIKSLISYKILLLPCLYFSYLLLLCVMHFHLNAAAVCNTWMVFLCHVWDMPTLCSGWLSGTKLFGLLSCISNKFLNL
jgi:hypothetical protein